MDQPKQYRKKPVVIEAMYFDGSDSSARAIEQWSETKVEWHFNNIEDNSKIHYNYLVISTLEGTMQANDGDYIIKGVRGEFYPCKPDIFEATYEMVDGKENN